MKTLILAPHPDDELIGCYSILNTHVESSDESDHMDVVFFYDRTRERMAEARNCARVFNFNIVEPEMINVDRVGYDRIFVPSRRDWHLDHKIINARFRQHATHFYSVDMDRGYPFSPTEVEKKKNSLDTLYPSQKKLWEGNGAYYLFEDIQVRDYDLYVSYDIKGERFGFKVTVLDLFEASVISFLNEKRETELEPEVIFNQLLKICSLGDVTLETFDGNTYKT